MTICAVRRALWCAAVTVASPAAAAAAPPAPPADPTSTTIAAATPAPASFDPVTVRAAKVGWARFVAGHADRPRNVSDPCPTLTPEALGWYLGQLGLTASARDYGAAIVTDSAVGGGVVALRCGVDINAAANPAGSVAVAVDVVLLDGQATFGQYAVRLTGRNDTIVESGPLPGTRLAGRCTNGGRSCSYGLGLSGLVVTVRATGLPADAGDALARQLVAAITPEVVANLQAVRPSTP